MSDLASRPEVCGVARQLAGQPSTRRVDVTAAPGLEAPVAFAANVAGGTNEPAREPLARRRGIGTPRLRDLGRK
jgi:hypothetical protein